MVDIVMGPEGIQPQTPEELNAEIIAQAVALSPGLTTNLPGSLVEDMASTATGAAIVTQQAMVESVNNVTPYGVNEFLLGALGYIYGVRPGQGTNTSVYVVFTGDVGFILPKGFTVSDGSYQYALADGGIIQSGGSSDPLLAVATQSGAWAVPAGTVTNIVSSVPFSVTLSVTNPQPGTPETAPETPAQYRARVMDAGLAVSDGAIQFLKTQLTAIPGVPSRLVSVRQVSGDYQILVGGSGDPYAIGYAIFRSLFNLNNLTGSTIAVDDFTAANPGVVTTDLTHGLVTGQTVVISGCDPSAYDGTFTATVLTPHTFSVGIDTSAFGSYVGDGILETNARNQSVSVNNYPDTYEIPFVVPPAQVVEIALTWSTSSPNVISNDAIQGISAPAMASYINTIPAGYPVNLYELERVFVLAVSGVIPSEQITRMDWVITIDGETITPITGTGIVQGDAESYLTCDVTDITLVRV